MQISVIGNIENEEKLSKGLDDSFQYRQISVTGGSGIVGSTVFLMHRKVGKQ